MRPSATATDTPGRGSAPAPSISVALCRRSRADPGSVTARPAVVQAQCRSATSAQASPLAAEPRSVGPRDRPNLRSSSRTRTVRIPPRTRPPRLSDSRWRGRRSLERRRTSSGRVHHPVFKPEAHPTTGYKEQLVMGAVNMRRRPAEARRELRLIERQRSVGSIASNLLANRDGATHAVCPALPWAEK